MITASVMKELNTIQLTRTKTLINNLLINFEFINKEVLIKEQRKT